MPDQSTPDTQDAGQPLSAAGKGHTGEPEAREERTADPRNPASKPQDTQRGQQKNMESERQPVQLPDHAGDLSASTDGTAAREREAKLAMERFGLLKSKLRTGGGFTRAVPPGDHK
ncbi:hypothetical protein LuPra_05173 [Luteitalea pratensis]|uniref:Uncharacterized protein n=1 Tax=Luteitalea pratensis TaxID=1855912 RepID=A0A143PTD2_LUTPR|nr:hypothetical protein LuPra_05173 [Luteitalea pratensis]